MKTYLVFWKSKGNLAEPKGVVIHAPTLVEAQLKFFEWLSKQPVFNHLWHLEFEVEEAIDGDL